MIVLDKEQKEILKQFFKEGFLYDPRIEMDGKSGAEIG